MSVARSRRTTLALAVAAALALCGGARAQSGGPTTIGDLTPRKVEVHKDTPAEANTPKAMENYKHFLELQNTDPKLRAEAMRRLGDLNRDAGEMTRLEQEVTAVDLQGAEAIRLYTTLLKAYPDYARNDQVLYQLARAYETTGQPEQAQVSLDQAGKRDPKDLDIMYHRGRAHLLVSKDAYEKMFTAKPDYWRVHQVLAQAYSEADRHSDAVIEYEMAIKAAPSEPGLHEMLGNEYWKAGEMDKATLLIHTGKPPRPKPPRREPDGGGEPAAG